MENTQTIIEFLSGIREYFVASWGPRKDFPFRLSPAEFIAFANREVKKLTDENRVNALSNIKRAIDCQIELLIYVLGHCGKAKGQGWSFPQKVEFIRSVGLVAPNILNRINKKRNQLEHEFQIPNSDEIHDALDVAELFLSYTDKFIERKYDFFAADDVPPDIDEDRQFYLSFDESRSVFEIKIADFGGERLIEHKYLIDDKDDSFLSLLKLYVGLMNQG